MRLQRGHTTNNNDILSQKCAGAASGLMKAPGWAAFRAHSPIQDGRDRGYSYTPPRAYSGRVRRARPVVLKADWKGLISKAPVPFTTTMHGIHMRLSVEFCEQKGIDPEKFAARPRPSTEDLREEDGVLIYLKEAHLAGAEAAVQREVCRHSQRPEHDWLRPQVCDHRVGSSMSAGCIVRSSLPALRSV